MKGSIALILLVVIFSACQPDNPTDPSPTNCNEPNTIFRYKMDGLLVDMSGSLTSNSKQGAVIRRTKDFRATPTGCGTSFSGMFSCQKYIYVLSATAENYWDDEWNTAVRIRFPSLIQGQTYSKSTFNSDWAGFFLPVEADGGFANSNLSLTITKLENGYADGTFSGTVFTGTISAPAYKTITEGEFKNVKVLL